jgi:FkbM family methyltransferase
MTINSAVLERPSAPANFTPLKTVKLSNGMEAFCISRSEASWIYEEVKGYLSHGIELQPGAVVLDVGANVGMFALYVNQQLNNDVTVYSFEPIPSIFNALQKNAQRYNAKGLKVFCYGLSQQNAMVDFDYYPGASVLSNAYPDESIGLDLAKDILVNNPKHAPYPGKLLQWLPYSLRSWLFDRLSGYFFKAERVSCQLRPMSEVIHEQNIQQIDLLKVDVEKCELDVLMGIKAEDWQKIRQVVVEVHNHENRLETVVELLKGYGFGSIVFEQEALFEGSPNFNVFARR